MEQISIWDILSKEETVVQSDIGEVYKEQDPVQDCGRRCDCSLFSLNCYIKRGYVRVNGKWLRNEDGSIMIIGGECDWVPTDNRIPEGWERIPDTAEVKAIEDPTDFTEPQDDPYIRYPDKVAKGRVNRIPCIIGYFIGVSGFDDCFQTLVPKFFKRTTIAPCPLIEYCNNNPAGCEGKTWWCGRTKQDFKEE